MKKIKLALAVFLYIQISWGQTASQSLSLSDAVRNALTNRYEVKIQKNNVEISKNEIKKITAKYFPQINADLDGRYNSKLQTNVIPGSFISNNPNAVDRLVQFGTKYSIIGGLSLNQTIFSPTNFSDKKIAEEQVNYNLTSTQKTANDVKQEVTEAYFTALLWKEKLNLSNNNFERTNAIFNTAKDQEQQGIITNYDTKRYQLDYENALAENKKNKNNYDLSINDLWYKMGEDSVKTDVLSDNIDNLFTQYATLNTNESEIKRPEMQLEKRQLEIYRLNYKKQNLAYLLPSVTFYGNLSSQYLNNGFYPYENTWYPYSYLGVKASLSIFDGFQKEKIKTEYWLRMQSSKMNYEKMERDYSQETRTAITSLKNSQMDLEYQKKNIELVNNLYKIDNDKLKNGTIKPNDLATTYYTMQQTQTNYLNAVYNYLIAVIKYKKAIGSL